MKRYLILICIGLLSIPLFSRDLNSEWRTIIRQYNQAKYDSANVNIANFINDIEKPEILEAASLHSHLFTAYYYYSSINILLGNYQKADSLFNYTEQFGIDNGMQARVKELRHNQILAYAQVYRDLKNTNSINASMILSKLISLSEIHQVYALLAHLYYDRAMLNYNNNNLTLYEQDLLKTIDFNNRYQNDERLTKAANEKLAQLYIDKKEFDALSNLNLNRESSVEIAIEQALNEENRGEYVRADNTLAKIQNDVFLNFSDDRILDYLKKRYILYDKRNLVKSGIDTLNVSIAKLISLNKSQRLLFSAREFQIAACLYNGMFYEAIELGDVLAGQFKNWSLDDDLKAKYFKMTGDINYLKGNTDLAILNYSRAVEYSFTLPRSQHYELLNNLGLAFDKNSQVDKARENFQRIYDETKDIEDTSQFFDIHFKAGINLGLIYLKTDQFMQASNIFNEIRRASSDKNLFSPYISASLRLAEVYQMQGFETLSESIFYEIEGKKNYLQNPLEIIQISISLSDYYLKKGNLHKAKALLDDAEVIAIDNRLNNHHNAIMEKSAQINFHQGYYANARGIYQKLLNYYTSQNDEHNQNLTRLKITLTYISENDYTNAENEVLNTIKSVYNGKTEIKDINFYEISFVDIFCKSVIYLSSIRFLQASEQDNILLLMKAYDEISEIISFMDNNKYLFIQESHSSFDAGGMSSADSYINAYKLKVDISTNLYNRTQDPRYLEEAFEISEKARSQAFITEAGSQIISKINNPKISNNAQLAFFSDRDKFQLEADDGMERGIKIKASSASGQVVQAQELQFLQTQYDELLKSLEDDKSSQLIDINTLSLSAIQNYIDDDVVILNYYVSTSNCYLFAIHKNKVTLLTVNSGYDNISSIIDAYRNKIMDYRSERHLADSITLYDLLIRPVETEIQNKKLIIIPSGMLNNLPFASLYDGEQYLLQKNTMTVLPNISLLQFINVRKDMMTLSSLFALGNPYNSIGSRLPGTEEEINAIKGFFTKADVFLGDTSIRSNLVRTIENKDILHFATHGLFDHEYPLLSGLMLTPESNNDDGIFRLFEIYNLNLSQTNLVVLSACETGLAKIKQNDDVIGLVRGFFFAGASNIIASLWKVSDSATSQLMIDFYTFMQQGNNISESIRNAQLNLANNNNTAHPYYWGAFNLYGYVQ